MATVIRRGKSRFWTAVYRDFEGRQHWVSTKLTKKDKAQRFAFELEDAARNNKLAEGQARRTLGRILEQVRGGTLGARKLREYAAQWLGRKKRECGAATWQTYASVIPRFVDSLGTRADDDVSTFLPSDVIRFRDHVAETLTVATANNQRRIVLALFGSAYAEGLLMDRIDAKRVPKLARRQEEEAGRRPFTMPEMKRILQVATGEWHGIILFGLLTGARLGDVARIQWGNVDLLAGEVTFTTRKTGRRMALPLAEPLQDYLAGLPSADTPEAPIFPAACRIATNNKGVGRLSAEFHTILVTAGLAAARENVETGKGRGAAGSRRVMSALSFHCLRHTATSLLKAVGASDAVAREFIGHESPAVSRQYTKLGVDALRKPATELGKLLTKGLQE